ncbi:YqaA family protein [Permianibacter aggregans]|uniref:Membrane protein YqaA with SNARE-associated domain n=1 Tax=Permianibacter aggregans TaxID=1510150 RepID=A0A4R6UVZ8_9GAMM|nr:VTT domain-containing protein [Permianibacter aggregans]QGX38656.1 DedA family protein [Permianibacter aggregans]TDQ50446.1 membrane protein YqaA with SNARE-associated domain [Permianibacter aggregans]
MKWLESFYRQVFETRYPWTVLGVFSFLETTILPIPLESVLIPFLIRNRDRMLRTAAVVTITCLLGASLFYLVGAYLMQWLGQPIIEWFASPDAYKNMREMLRDHGFLFVLATGISPIPFQIGMLAAGAGDYSFWLFLLAASIARAIRYFGLVWLVHHYGDEAETLWQRNKLKAGLWALLIVLLFYLFGRAIQAWLMA